ncbi:ADP-ribosylation factor-like protein, putative [Plasmodium knowlesi strain H]|uniref:ADP-ribosylation factor-like protein, putative n=3 Tax=Plasmodium knowlesi TaxID=5850 RepID=A0A5K1V383_PLAKH|nr:ADP-ribosylation factor, putative [Plasmodium knowlesi strain H]OTN67513.1 putative ADP-ribosylation factor-like protein [Plasmodium knowlesi]CAA9987475.1 ADP-ribosylation factor, putative [Plasmodium knowlesi strain H]SBO23207.1 ADP-ribosylation factor-like protein, putative [Plasmodium knowlesi strain H]SBO23971.1 ADP-ribosylation factor-like protein, putative [Plasmodium knowlesi strain H]VVS76949.1 ADP-ribosylation factor, putative [Plasmodium knowlesi strain H]|eukprot:XP_002258476.1 ADP-ribosylation factor-like protein, putative [Plasmodium knowlesi strain H]
MGNAVTSFMRDCCDRFFRKQIIFQIRICGPAQSGKTTLVKYLVHSRFLKVKPTEGLVPEKIDFEEFSVIIWDSRYSIEDDASINRLDIDAVIYCIDLSDHGRLKIAKRGFYKVLQDYNHIDDFLVVASKQDRKSCMLLQHVRSELKIDHIVDRNCHLAECSSKTGHGVEPAMNWLFNQLMNRRKRNLCFIK